MQTEIAQAMLDDLQSHQLEVMRGSFRPSCRVVIDHNIPWYRELCASFEANRKRPRRKRKPDTRIKRQSIIEILTRIATGKESRSKYVEELERLAYKYGYTDE